MKQETYFCDIKDCGHQIVTNRKKISLHVIFHTEQTEGRGIDPYLSPEQLDLCDECYSRVLNGVAIHGSGAMGYNEYYFEELDIAKISKYTAGEIQEKVQAMTMSARAEFVSVMIYHNLWKEFGWKVAALADSNDQLKARNDEIIDLEKKIKDFETNWVPKK